MLGLAARVVNLEKIAEANHTLLFGDSEKPGLKARAHTVFLRCQYGTYEDAKFKQFCTQLEGAEVPWTPYLFWVANVDAGKQINLFMKLAGHMEDGGVSRSR
jgi:hypothetical protein